jgi:DNA repair exonuclease SbcCD ATPase subunit
MLGSMKVQAEKEMEGEASTFRKYTDWADDQLRELGFEIRTGKSEVEKLTSTIEEADLDVESLGKKVDKIEKDIERMETEMDEATKVRKEESDEFLKTAQDLSESIQALEKASEVISSGAQDQEQASVLLQRMSISVPKMSSLLATLQQMSDELGQEQQPGAPAAAAYKSQSDGVLSLLNSLEEKFKKELDESQLEESNKAHHYDMEMQHLTDTVKAEKVDLSQKKAEKGKTEAESAKAKGELTKTKAELKEDEKMRVEVQATFTTKKELFDTNQKTRKEEIVAMSKAIEIISSPEVAGSYSENINLKQVTSLLQTHSSKRRVVARQRVSRFLEQRATLLSSKTLATFASEVAASPFAKVIDLIKGLIAKLKEEAAAEADHKKWCDDELKANKLTRDSEGSKAEKLEASVEKLGGQIDTMAKEISTLLAEQSDLAKAMSKATSLRSEEKEQNEETMKEADAGAEATKKAITILKEFYSSQSFLQQVPEMEKYSGQQGASKGIVGMLEVIESDFRRLAAETNADEKLAVTEYNKFMSEAKKNKGEKHEKTVKLKLDKDKAEFDKSQAAKDLRLTKDKLLAADKYYETLKPTCTEIHVSFEERAKKRQEEIEALKEAYGILDGKSD